MKNSILLIAGAVISLLFLVLNTKIFEALYFERQFSNEMFDRIDKVDLTTLGWIGFAVLMWTVVSTLGHVETAVNEVWHVKAHRPIWRKFIVYLFVVVILPFGAFDGVIGYAFVADMQRFVRGGQRG